MLKEWSVKYTDVERMKMRYPFFKCVTVVEAYTKKEALEIASNKFPRPKYEIKSASSIGVI